MLDYEVVIIIASSTIISKRQNNPKCIETGWCSTEKKLIFYLQICTSILCGQMPVHEDKMHIEKVIILRFPVGDAIYQNTELKRINNSNINYD